MVELRSITLTWKVVILNSISIIVINAILFRLFYFGYICHLKLSTDFKKKQCKYIDILMNALYIILNPKNYYKAPAARRGPSKPTGMKMGDVKKCCKSPKI